MKEDRRMRVSNHARKRMKERCGTNKKSSDRVANLAFERGLTHQEVTGKLCRWVDGVYLKHHTGNQIRLYNGKVFIFHNDVLVTVKPIPSNLMYLVDIAFKKRKERGVQHMESCQENNHVCTCNKARLQPGDIVQHFKHESCNEESNAYTYKILLIAYNQDDMKQVVYQALYGPDFKTWVRDYDEFMQEVDKGKHPDVHQKYVYELLKRDEHKS